MFGTVEEAVRDVPAGTYVVAVSGGQDSVALLHALRNRPDLKLIVAHFDHGIRDDSDKDRRFVEELAGRLNLPFVWAEGKLGRNTSEADARRARYEFLDRTKEDHNADAVITAHHADDLIETLIINILRGTYRKGLSSLRSRPGLLRPLLNVKRETIVHYAKGKGLKWHEDPSNQDTRYLRNYVRLVMTPKIRERDPAALEKLYEISTRMLELNDTIDQEVLALVTSNCQLANDHAILSRYWFTMLPSGVRNEVLACILRQIDETATISTDNLKRASHFLITAKVHKKMQVSKTIEAVIQPKQVAIKLTKV